MAFGVVEMRRIERPPALTIDMARLSFIVLVIGILFLAPRGTWLVGAMVLLTLVWWGWRYRGAPKIRRCVNELQCFTDDALRRNDAGGLRARIDTWHWLCFFGAAAAVYEAWGRLLEMEERYEQALNYYQRALQAGSALRMKELYIQQVRVHKKLAAHAKVREMAQQLVARYPQDMFLRHRLEMMTGVDLL